MAAKKGSNRARFIVAGSIAAGLIMIFASALNSSLKRGKLLARCRAHDVAACLKLCYRAPHLQEPCSKLETDCRDGQARACEALEMLEEKGR